MTGKPRKLSQSKQPAPAGKSLAARPGRKPPARRPARSREPVIPPDQAAVFRRLDVPYEDWLQPSGLVIAFAHSLTVPAGRFIGKPLRLRFFQLEFIRDIYNPQRRGRRKRRQAVLSIGRRGGKTLTAAILVLVHLAGPMRRVNSTIISAATTRKQASIVFRYVADITRLNR